MRNSGNRSAIILTIVALLCVESFLQVKIDPQRHQFEPGNSHLNEATKGLPIEFALGAVIGFREAVAGLLWVRTDDFFDSGDYEAIPPIVRIITWLDPHQTNVYQTGAWHLDYNFSDTDQRADRRQIPLAVALLQEGVDNNPNNPEMCSDLAFTHYYRKLADYIAAKNVFLQGKKEIANLDTLAKKYPKDAELAAADQAADLQATSVGHGLAHACEALGDTQGAMDAWNYSIDMHKRNLAAGFGSQYGESQSLAIAGKDLQEDMYRAAQRKNLGAHQEDVGFNVQLVRVAPREFVVQGTLRTYGYVDYVQKTGKGTLALIDGSRVEVRLQDAGYKTPVLKSFSMSSLNVDPNLTIMQDSISVENGQFQKKIDMSQDPQMYSFKAPKYTFTVWWNAADPDDTPINVKDRYGWLGEGMTDKHLDTSGIVPGDAANPIPGLRYVKKVFSLSQDDITGSGKKTFVTDINGND
ncbi:MAG: hypothetical protein ACLQVD_15425 [Capsulimonadaceae bacterium]